MTKWLYFCVLTSSALAQEVSSLQSHEAPPPAPPIIHRTETALPAPREATQGAAIYSIGQPTDEEQLYLEYVNRMRANPTAEGQLLAATTDPDVRGAYKSFSVDTNLMKLQFSTNPPVPPLAMNKMLMDAARWHSGDMFTNIYQDHYQSDGAGGTLAPWDRVEIMGYSYGYVGENIFSYSKSVFYGHAGFAVDWGYGTGGMQTPPGHRNSMFSPNFREVGMGIYNGVNGSVGPQLITQDFGTTSSPKPFITGVAYYDLNGNNFYDIGEGIGGITVTVPGSSYSAVTADSGGYAIPVTTNGTYTITFAGSLLSTQRAATITSAKNVKVDFTPLYSAPVISGPSPAYLNQSNFYTFTTVGAATSYRWIATKLSNYTMIEGAENGLTNVTVQAASSYPVIASDVKASGSYSFHLATADAASQYITLKPVLRPATGGQLTFAKRLGTGTSDQVARVQITTDGKATWKDLWTQAGNGGIGDTTFSTITLPLGGYAGTNIQIRFAYTFSGGSYYNQSSTGFGLYIDNIAFTNAYQVSDEITNTVTSGNSFAFSPTTNAIYSLQVQPVINSRILNWGPALSVTTTSAPPTIALSSKPVLANGQIRLDFNVSNYRTNLTFLVWKASDINGTWTQDTTGTIQTIVSGQQFRFTAPTPGSSRMFYRISCL